MLGGAGLWLLLHFVNPLTMWLTLATFVGYAVIYTVILKPATPQNIVIGGASGAMPPVLGWAAVTGDVTIEPLLLFLIIFAWTPPHFWSLALYRTEDYARAGRADAAGHARQGVHAPAGAALHADPLRRHACCPTRSRMSGVLYLVAALGAGRRVPRLRAAHLSRTTATRSRGSTFRYSIVYLPLLFAALLVDHYL